MKTVADTISEICGVIPEPFRSELQSIVSDQLLLGDDEVKVVEDKYAYRWCDLLAWEDVIAFAGDMLSGKDPASSGILGLLKLWAKHRSLRVALDKGDADVLRSVKKGNNTFDRIIESTKSTAAAGNVGSIIQKLMCLKDSSGRAVLTHDPTSDTYNTPF